MKRNMSKKSHKTTTKLLTRFKKTNQQNVLGTDCSLRKSASCPGLVTNFGCSLDFIPSKIWNTNSTIMLKEDQIIERKLVHNYPMLNVPNRAFSSYTSVNPVANQTHSAFQSMSASCACPAPSSCLPPPCNTPPKCLQYMTGYYYYPYGTWFCGPYHVKTGSCGPCSGPVPCGQPPCPCGPCKPCGPCAPLSCCGVCSVNGQPGSNQVNQNSMHDPWHMFNTYSYMQNPYTTYYGPYSYNPYNQYSHNMDNSYIGPCYNVPIEPTPVHNPMPHTQPTPQNPQASAPIRSSSISWPPTRPKVSGNDFTNTNSNMTKSGSPQPTHFSPAFPHGTNSPDRTHPFTKPRVNARTMLPSNSIGVCYFTTKCMPKCKSSKFIKSRRKVKKCDIREKAGKVEHTKKIRKDWALFDRSNHESSDGNRTKGH